MELVRMQREAIDSRRKERVGLAKDDEWSGDGFVKEAESMVAN
jgi:dihydropyrimidine dehydrogenase (NADP+)